MLRVSVVSNPLLRTDTCCRVFIQAVWYLINQAPPQFIKVLDQAPPQFIKALDQAPTQFIKAFDQAPTLFQHWHAGWGCGGM